MASASFDGTVSIWEEEDDGMWDCTAQLEGHENEVKSVVWSMSGMLLASCGRDKSVWIWEYMMGESGGEEEFDCLAVLHGHSGDVKCIVFTENNGQWGDGDEVLLSASYDDSIKCWAEDGGEWYCASTLSSHSSTVWCIAPTPAGMHLISASDDCSLAIWKCYTKAQRKELKNDPESSGNSGLWKCVGKLPSAHRKTIYTVHCAPACARHGRIVSGGGDNSINIYRESSRKSDEPLYELDHRSFGAHEGDINCVQWHPKDGSLLASVGDDGNIKIWKYSFLT